VVCQKLEQLCAQKSGVAFDKKVGRLCKKKWGDFVKKWMDKWTK
jgi:hypothetical protein